MLSWSAFLLGGVSSLARRLLLRGVFFAASPALLRRGFAGDSLEIAPVVAAVRIQASVVLGGPENPLHVVLGLGKRDVVDEFVLVESGTLRLPS